MYMYKAPVSHTLNKISTIVSVSNVAVLQLRVRGVDHNGSGDKKFSLGFDLCTRFRPNWVFKYNGSLHGLEPHPVDLNREPIVEWVFDSYHTK